MAIFIPNTLCDEKFRFLAVYGPSAPKHRKYIKKILNKEAKAFEEVKRRGYVDADARFPYDARKAKLEEQVKQPEFLDSLAFFDFAESSFDVLTGVFVSVMGFGWILRSALAGKSPDKGGNVC